MRHLKTFEEIINIPTWKERPENNFWIFPMMNFLFDLPQSLSPKKKWKIDNDLTGSWFKNGDNNLIFLHLNTLNFETLDEPGQYSLKRNYRKIAKLKFNKFGLGTVILRISLEEYEDGLRVMVTGGNNKLIQKLGIKGSGVRLYKSFVKETGIPIYSDYTQTADSRTKIWGNLIKDGQCEVVAWDQVNREEIEIISLDGDLVARGREKIYWGDVENAGDPRNLIRKKRTRLLKLKSVK